MRKYTTEDIINLFKGKNGNKYSYDKFIYTKMHDKGIITCPIHGDFLQDAHSHLKGHGCPKCALLSRSEKRKDTKDSFIEKSIKIHSNKYLYDKVEYKSSQEYVIVTCPIHGDFKIKPYLHVQGQGCPKCYNEKRKTLNLKSKEEFITELKLIYNNRYDFSNINYINYNTKIDVVCNEHGSYKRSPNELLHGKHCPLCMEEERKLNHNIKFKNNFIIKAKKIHNDKYCYDKVVYINSNTPVEIICPIHGSFYQNPSYHLSGNGCQQCAKEMIVSKDENDLFEFVINVTNNVKKSDRKILPNNNELDIYIPDKKIAIEYDGLHWHCELHKDKNYHLNKTLECERQGIRLIHIFEDEWLHKQEIVKSRIKNVFGITDNRVFARKCKIKEVSHEESKRFLNENHIQGICISKYRYGLYYNNELVSLMTFGKLRKNLGSVEKDGEYELLRFCNKLNTSVVGGASKLLKHFIDEVKPKTIISYADRRWSDGHLYETLGFEHTHDSKPSYYYVIRDMRYNRFSYRKDVLIKKYDCPKDISEHEFMKSKGWYRIYDCGTKCYKMFL